MELSDGSCDPVSIHTSNGRGRDRHDVRLFLRIISERMIAETIRGGDCASGARGRARNHGRVRITVGGVENSTRIDRESRNSHHLCSGPSRNARVSSVLSRLTPAGKPIFKGLTTNGLCFSRRCAVSPRRNKRFTVSLKDSPECRASWRTSSATSSSMETAVRTS